MRTMPKYTTNTFITEALYFVTYVQLFEMTATVKVMDYTMLTYFY